MLCLSVNVRKLKIIAVISLSAILAGGIIYFMQTPEKTDRITLDSNSSRVGFLNMNGYDVSEENYQCDSVHIPYDFSAVYEQYNQIQIKQGFNLSKFKGKEADIYTYHLNNDENMNLVLIMHDNTLIGCDVHNSEYGSEILPLIN